MTKLATRDEWIQEQLTDKYLRKSYRNVLIHASIIEGVLKKASRMNTFANANKFLLCSGKISRVEFCHFEDIKNVRNKLVHEIYTKGLTQDQIDTMLETLIGHIKAAYRNSPWLDKKLFAKHHIDRPKCIALQE